MLLPNTYLAQTVLEQSLQEATPTINQGEKPSSRFRDTSFVQPEHLQAADCQPVHAFTLAKNRLHNILKYYSFSSYKTKSLP